MITRVAENQSLQIQTVPATLITMFGLVFAQLLPQHYFPSCLQLPATDIYKVKSNKLKVERI